VDVNEFTFNPVQKLQPKQGVGRLICTLW